MGPDQPFWDQVYLARFVPTPQISSLIYLLQRESLYIYEKKYERNLLS